MEEDSPRASGAGLRTTSWLRPQDMPYAEEDDEANAEQAARNARMRDMLKKRREQAVPAPKAKHLDFESGHDFMAVKASRVFDRQDTKEVSDSKAALLASVASTMSSSSSAPPPWVRPRPELTNSVLRLHEELLDFAKFMGPTQEEETAREAWVQCISDNCKAIWPDCEVGIFGSYSTGLCLPNGDVDVSVLNVPDRPVTAMKKLADRMLSRNEVSWLETIDSAKVPVVKLRQQTSGLRADVVFNQPDGVKTSKFVKDRCKEYPQMKVLLIFLKYFLMQRGLHETFTGGMGSYLLSNVVLHFMQQHPSKKKPQTYAATSLGHLLYDFFKYYGIDFSYQTKGISVRNGGCTFFKGDTSFGFSNRRGGDRLSLCLESPFGDSVDLGGPCFRIGVLKNLFMHGLSCLSHLFSSPEEEYASLLCPLLLDPTHPVIASRERLLMSQPAALPSFSRFPTKESLPEEPPRKKRRKSTD